MISNRQLQIQNHVKANLAALAGKLEKPIVGAPILHLTAPMTQDALLNAFVTFFVTIDPPGLVGIFLALTGGMTSKQRRQTALRGTCIGIAILLAFMMVGGILLQTLGISMAAFRIAGGLLLFYIAFEMVFEKRAERKVESAKRVVSQSEMQSIAVFPLAIPLIAGPGAHIGLYPAGRRL